jgi:hypothetical protein
MMFSGVIAILACVFVGTPPPSPEACNQTSPGIINCNFDRQEAQIVWTVDQISYVVMAIAIGVLALAIYSVATGKSPLPVALNRRVRRTPASVADIRKASAAIAITAFAVLLDMAGLDVSYPGGFGHTAGPLFGSPFSFVGPFMMFVGLIVALGLMLQVRFLDRRRGTVTSGADQLRGRPPLSPDGAHYWDGQRWVSTLSPDGRYRWNGDAWVRADESRHT